MSCPHHPRLRPVSHVLVSHVLVSHVLVSLAAGLLLLLPGAGTAHADGPGPASPGSSSPHHSSPHHSSPGTAAHAENLPRELRWGLGALAAVGVMVGFGAASRSLREPEGTDGHLIDPGPCPPTSP